MIPIYKLLSRIRWDTRFGDASFELEYEDRMSGMIKIPLGTVTEVNTFTFIVQNITGEKIAIPLHRVKKVFRNGDCIWSRG